MGTTTTETETDTVNIPAITAALKEGFRTMHSHSPLTISSRKTSVALPRSLAAATAISVWANRVGPVKPSDLKPVGTIANVNTVDGFKAALAVAKKGGGIVYHTGFLMGDRLYDGGLRLVADAAMRAATAQQVSLVQRRLGERVFEYIAIKLSNVDRTPGSAGWVTSMRPGKAA